MARAGCSMSRLSLECALSPVLVYLSICWSPVELPVGAGPPIEPKNQYHIHCDKIEEHRIKAFLLTCCCIVRATWFSRLSLAIGPWSNAVRPARIGLVCVEVQFFSNGKRVS